MEIRLKEVQEALLATKGILDVRWIEEKDRTVIRGMEEQLCKQGLGGLGKAYNEGVFSVLSRELVCVVLNNNDFRHADVPCLSWVVDDLVIGEEITDLGKLESLKAQKDIKIIGRNFVVYFDRVRQVRGREPSFVFRGLHFPEIEGIAAVRDVVSASPMGAADSYLKTLYGWDTEDPELGTILIGFNLRES